MKRFALMAAFALVTALPAVAQDRLSAGARVRLALPQGEIVEGRVLRGDSTSLTVRTQTAGIVAVPRERILLITMAASGNGQRVFQSAAVSGVVGALAVGALTTRCNAGQDCRPNYLPMAIVGMIGAGFGSIGQGGPSAAQWRPVSNAAPVMGSSSLGSASSCGQRPSLQLRFGLSGAASRTASGAVSLFCYQRMTMGVEGGLLRDLVVPGRFYANDAQPQTGSYIYYFSSSAMREDKRRAVFAGMVGDLEMSGPFSPHLLLSAGAYRRSDATTTTTMIYNYGGSTYTYLGPTSLTAKSSASFTMPGIGAGMAIYGPGTKDLSLGITARGHYLLGYNGGAVVTLEGTARIR